MAELHAFGQILGASGFEYVSLFCRWIVESSESFRLIEGDEKGQTQNDTPADGEMFIWAHPIDLHYQVTGLRGWPKIALQVWGIDKSGRSELAGYGFIHIPSTAGTFDLECSTWRPAGSLNEQIAAFFVGGNPLLKDEKVILSKDDRWRLEAVTSGIVKIRLSVILRDFEKYGISY